MAKRQAVLDAARDLFVTQGVDRVSMDTVAAEAQVSKATVYGYFGDKERLFRAILADASESLDHLAQRALATHLGDDAGITSVAQLEVALTAGGVNHKVETYPAKHGWVFRDTPVFSAACSERHWATLTTLLNDTLRD